MPNIASSRKRVRTTAKRTAINTARKTRVRGFIRKVEEAIAKGDKKAALAALKAAEPEIMRGVSKGILHKNTGVAEGFPPDQAGRKTVKIGETAESFDEFKSRGPGTEIRAFFIVRVLNFTVYDVFALHPKRKPVLSG